ncbi:MAG: hypothetical protein ACJA08_001484 [Cyclobacteriaceae bacterium]|jgi:hypothetical protein
MNYLVEGTKHTPFVKISSAERSIQIKGVSHPEHALSFYLPIIEKLKTLVNLHDKGTWKMEVFMEYFNTSSAKCLFDIFRQVKHMKTQGMEINIKWCYEEEDEDMMETGEDYNELLDLDFLFVEVPYEEMSSI